MSAKYDVAISFLEKDKSLALQVEAKLSESLKVFVYSNRQENLAGTDGLESFRQVFHAESRMVVVLYRDGWGQTPWTRVEEAAIKDRCLAEGWDWLLFVTLDNVCKPPVWLPKSEIRLSFPQYGFDQLIGAIKVRAEKLGSTMRVESTLDRAKRLERDGQLRAEREDNLARQGTAAARREYDEFKTVVRDRVEELNGQLKTIQIGLGLDGLGCTLRTNHVGVNCYLYVTQPSIQSRIVVQDWNGPILLPDERGRLMFPLGSEPKSIAKKEFYFDYQAAYGWCWHPQHNTSDFLSTVMLADKVVSSLLDLHDRYEKGLIRRRGDW